MSDDDFFNKENIRRSFRREEYREKQGDQRERDRERSNERQNFANEQRTQREAFQERRDVRARDERFQRDLVRLENQWDVIEAKRQQAIADSDHKAVATLEAEQEKTRREIELFKMGVERDARMLKADQDFDPIRRGRDLEDYKTRSVIDSQAYAHKGAIDRRYARQLHGDKMAELKAGIYGRLIESAQNHKQEQEMSAQEHEQRKDFESHRTEEKIYFFEAISRIKREQGDEMADEMLRAMADIFSSGSGQNHADNLNEEFRNYEFEAEEDLDESWQTNFKTGQKFDN